MIDQNVLDTTNTSNGETLGSLTRRQAALVVFLRHSGCTFCREALADLALRRQEIESKGVAIVIVHMMTPERGDSFLARYQMGDVAHVSDSDRRLYEAFGIGRGSIRQLLAPKVWLRGLEATLQGHGMGAADGDPFQMPGVVLIRGNDVLDQFHFETPADRPDYVQIAATALEKASA